MSADREKDIELFYKTVKESAQSKLIAVKKKIALLGTIRLIWVIGAFALIYSLWGTPLSLLVTVILACIVSFLFLIKYHNKLFIEKSFLESKVAICDREFNIKKYNFEGINDGGQWNDPSHDYGYDLDIFGRKSLFAYINRSASWLGEKCLAGMLKSPLKDSKTIISRQQAVKELSEFSHFRIEFMARGKMTPMIPADKDKIENISKLPSFVSSPILRGIIMTTPFIYLALFILWGLSLIPGLVILYLFLACLFIAISFGKVISRRHQLLGSALQSLRAYGNLIGIIEENKFKSEELQQIQRDLQSEGEPVSLKIKRLSRLMDNLDQRYNAVGAAILNGFFLWDFKQLIHIDYWIARHGSALDTWLESLAHFDALISLSTFAFNHPRYVYPEPNDTHSPSFIAREMGHPLIPQHVCVCNDVNIEGRPAFLVITGANMAGKSTYLRVIGVNYLLASLGVPVYAKEMRFSPASLFTSLRTTDSLSDNESYFFAELKRLQEMILRLRGGEKMFIILDEILKGTNSVDKQSGSLALIRQLVSLHAVGVIATHDLKLGELATHFPHHISNYRFEADIVDGELSFSYHLLPGIAQNMNACFLMKKMGIIPD